MARVLVLGASGLLGQYVSQEGLARGHEVWGTYLSTPLAKEGVQPLRADVADFGSLETAFTASRPDWTVLTAALTGVDFCEAHPYTAQRVNDRGPRAVARLCHERDSRLVHISTDYVFDGRHGPYAETEMPKPLNVYGATKLAGEMAVHEEHPTSLVLRLCAVYGWNRLRDKPNSVTWILGRLRRGETAPLFTDQRVSPTYAAEAASAIFDLAAGEGVGIVHLAPEDCVSRLELGEAVCDVFDLPKERLQASTLRKADLPAPRPRHSCLRSSGSEALKREPRRLRDALAHMREAE